MAKTASRRLTGSEPKGVPDFHYLLDSCKSVSIVARHPAASGGGGAADMEVWTVQGGDKDP